MSRCSHIVVYTWIYIKITIAREILGAFEYNRTAACRCLHPEFRVMFRGPGAFPHALQPMIRLSETQVRALRSRPSQLPCNRSPRETPRFQGNKVVEMDLSQPG